MSVRDLSATAVGLGAPLGPSSPKTQPVVWASATGDGMLVVDVYESREAADRFARDRFGPASQQLGVAMPEMTEYEVHNYVQP
jgi:hypothetical protein